MVGPRGAARRPTIRDQGSAKPQLECRSQVASRQSIWSQTGCENKETFLYLMENYFCSNLVTSAPSPGHPHPHSVPTMATKELMPGVGVEGQTQLWHTVPPIPRSDHWQTFAVTHYRSYFLLGGGCLWAGRKALTTAGKRAGASFNRNAQELCYVPGPAYHLSKDDKTLQCRVSAPMHSPAQHSQGPSGCSKHKHLA